MQRWCYGCLMRHDMSEFDGSAKQCRAYKARKARTAAGAAAQVRLLAAVRGECALSQRALAGLLNVTGDHMHQMERGAREVAEPKLIEVASMLITRRRKRGEYGHGLDDGPWVQA